MRPLALALSFAFALAGCSSPAGEDAPEAPTMTTPTSGNGAVNATGPQPLVGERGPAVTERFLFAQNHSLRFVREGEPELSVARLPEAFTGVDFYTAQSPAALLAPWAANPAMTAYEVTGDIPITIRFVAQQSGTSATKPLQLAPVGGWLGTAERWAVFFQAADAPETIEANKEYVARATASMADLAYFMRQGEQLALYTYVAYQTPDNSRVSYVVGGPEAAGLAVPHSHFNVSAPASVVVLEKSGTIAPNPFFTSEQNPQPVEHAFDVPPGTAYVVAVVDGAGQGGQRIDVDLKLKTAAGILGESTGPDAKETVVLGPTALAKAGGKLIARVVGAGSAGGTYKLTITAFGQLSA